MRMVYDFTPGTLPSGVTFAQPTADFDGSYVDADGVIQYASGPDELRWEHRWDGAAWALAGLLNEPERTNIRSFSEAVNSWSNTATIVSIDVAVAPDGATTADRMEDNAAGTSGQTGQILSVADLAPGLWAMTAFIAPGSLDWLRFRTQTFTQNTTASFDAASGAFGGNNGFTSSFVDRLAGAWFRAGGTAPEMTGPDMTGLFRWNLADGNADDTVLRDGTKNIYLWGGGVEQVETGDPFASSYIRNTGSGSATRAAGVTTITETPEGLPLPNGTYHVEIVRYSGTTTLSAVVVSGGAGYVVPTSTDPLRVVILTPVVDRIANLKYLLIGSPLTVEGGLSRFPYAWGEVAWGSLSDDEEDLSAKVYLGSHTFHTGASDSERNAIFRPRLLQAFNFSQQIPPPGLGQSRGGAGIGAVRIANGDGALDDELLRAWPGRSVRVLVGGTVDEGRPTEHEMVLAEYVTLFLGTAEALAGAENEIEIAIRDPSAKLDLPIVANLYAGTGGLEGGDDLAGKPKPKGFGAVFNASPATVDPVNLIYQVHDGAMSAVTAVRDAGVALAFDADVADITTATPGTGEYATSLATGHIKLGASPAGGITVDFNGDASGSGYVSTVADVIERIVVTYGPLFAGDLDAASFTSLNSAKSYTCGLYTGMSRPKLNSLVDQLMLSVDGFWAMTRAGLLSVGTYVQPENEAANYSLAEDGVFEGSLEALPSADPIWRLRLGYRRNWAPQSEGELAGSVTAANRAAYSQQQKFVSEENQNTRDVFPLAIENERSTLLNDQADAETETTAILSRQRRVRRTYRWTSRLPLYQLKVGVLLSLTHSRMGLSSGKNLIVLQIEEDANARAVRITAWG